MQRVRERGRWLADGREKGIQRQGQGEEVQGGGTPPAFSWCQAFGGWDQVKWHGLPRQSPGSSVAVETVTTAPSCLPPVGSHPP